MAEIRIEMTRAALDELAECERGRYEDRQKDAVVTNPHQTYLIARRVLDSTTARRVVLVIDDYVAAADVYFAVCSGTFQFAHPRYATKIADALRPFVERTQPDVVARWPYPMETGRGSRGW